MAEAARQASGKEDVDSRTPPKRTEPDGPVTAPKRRGRPPKGEQPRVTQKAASGQQSDAQRHQGIEGLVQVGSALCLVASNGAKKPQTKLGLKADAITLLLNQAEIADAVVETAKADERFGRLVDRVTAAGPYAALIGVMFKVGTQCARNHGLSALPGTTDPQELVTLAEEPSDLAAAA